MTMVAVGIHPDRIGEESYSEKWAEFLHDRNVEVRLLDLLAPDALDQACQCGGVMWRWAHNPQRRQSAQLAVGFGWSVHLLLAAKGKWLLRLALLVSVAVPLALVAHEAPRYLISPRDWHQGKYGELYLATQQLAWHLSERLEPDARIYQWGGEAGLYFHSGLRPASGVFYSYPLVQGPSITRLTARVLRDLNRRPPEFFVVARWMERDRGWAIPAPLATWLHDSYEPYTGDYDHRHFDVYVRVAP